MRDAEKKLAYTREYYRKRRELIKRKVSAWAAANPEKRKQYRQRWSERHPERANEWIRSHPDKKAEYSRRWRTKNPNHGKEYARRNRARIRAVKAAYEKKNRSAMREYRREWEKCRAARDPVFKLTQRLRLRLRLALKGERKAGRFAELLGCSCEFARSHIEAQFRDGMTWSNYGVDGWEIDHIKPCAAFDLSQPGEQQKCFHFSNLQPLWASENRSKSDYWRVPDDVKAEF